mgnify:CR=1 FL=1
MGKASILIPSPNVAENHQYHNAMALVSKDAAVLIEEKDLTGERLAQELDRLLSSPQRRRQLEANAKALAITDANERIYAVIAGLARRINIPKFRSLNPLRRIFSFHAYFTPCIVYCRAAKRPACVFMRKGVRQWRKSSLKAGSA